MLAIYEDALDGGILPDEFWEMSPLEIYDRMASIRRREERRMREEITKSFAMLHAEMRFKARQKETDPIPQPWDYYPVLFAEEKKQHDEAEEMKSVSETAAGRRAYAAEFNRRRKEAKV